MPDTALFKSKPQLPLASTVPFDIHGVLIDTTESRYALLSQGLRLICIEIGRYDGLVTYNYLPMGKELEIFTQECRI